MSEDTAPSKKVEEILKELDMTKEEADGRLTDMLASGSRSAILFSLFIYKSLNLKTLSRFIGKSKSTTLEHIKKLKEQGYIEIDEDSSKWGKFYRPEPVARLLMEYDRSDIDSTDVEAEFTEKYVGMDFSDIIHEQLTDLTTKPGYRSKVIDLQNLLNRARETSNNFYRMGIAGSDGSFYHLELASILIEIKKKSNTEELIQRIIDIIPHASKTPTVDFSDIDKNNLEDLRKYIFNNLSERKYKTIIEKLENGTKLSQDDLRKITIGNLSATMEFFNFSNVDQLGKFVSLLFKFQAEMNTLHEELEKENEGLDPKDFFTQILNVFAFPMAKIE